MKYFDTHAHYDDDWFRGDREEIIASLPVCGIDCVLNCGTEQKSNEASVHFAETYDFFYAAVGWHPHDAAQWTSDCVERIRDWARNPKVVAVGEIGLDYHYDADWKPLQWEVLETQLCLAEELNLPVIIHDREAHRDALDAVLRHPDLRGEFHCYSGSADMARILLDRGWYLGFNGSITMQGARKSKETIEMMPLDRFLLETDCPYLAPMPRTDGKRNDSRKLPRVAELAAAWRGISVDELVAAAWDNGHRLFNIAEIKF